MTCIYICVLYKLQPPLSHPQYAVVSTLSTDCPYQLHPAELIHKCHVSCHDLLQGVIEFTQLLQGFLFGLLILFLIQFFSGINTERMRN